MFTPSHSPVASPATSDRVVRHLALASAAVAVVTLAARWVDDRTLLGQSVWTKPSKFVVSIGLLAAASTWLLRRLERTRPHGLQASIALAWILTRAGMTPAHARRLVHSATAALGVAVVGLTAQALAGRPVISPSGVAVVVASLAGAAITFAVMIALGVGRPPRRWRRATWWQRERTLRARSPRRPAGPTTRAAVDPALGDTRAQSVGLPR